MKYLKYVNIDVLFQEIPDEVSLGLSISGCKNNCKGCHSSYLMGDIGTELTFEHLSELINKYDKTITNILFLGGDNDMKLFMLYLKYIRVHHKNIKISLYSGLNDINISYITDNLLDYYKIGSYKEELGALNSKTTNQRLYKIENGYMCDITWKFLV